MRGLLLVSWLLLAALAVAIGPVAGEPKTRPVLLLPGFASSQLQAWRHSRCETGFRKNLYRDVNIGDRKSRRGFYPQVHCKRRLPMEIQHVAGLWIDIGRVLAQSDCWISCMKLDITSQNETHCKLRCVPSVVSRGLRGDEANDVIDADSAPEGLDAISELDPGLVTGPLSTVWGSMIKDLVQHFHLEPDQLIVASYDWRLPPSKLQERDRYFYTLMKKSKLIVFYITLSQSTH